MPQRVELARPVVRSTCCLHPHHAARQPAHEPQHLRAPQLPADYHPPAAIRTAKREHTLCQVDPDRCNFHLEPSSLSDVAHTSLAHCEAVYSGRGPYHQSQVSGVLLTVPLDDGAGLTSTTASKQRGHSR